MTRRRWFVLIVVTVLAVPGVLAARRLAGLRSLGTPVHHVTSDAPAPAPLRPGGGPVHWTASPEAGGRITDVAVLPHRGLVIAVEEVAHRSWKATAFDAHTGEVRWSHGRGHTGHIEAWTVTDAAVVLAYHHSASRLAWRTHRAVSFQGLEPLSGRVLWTRHVYNLYGEGPGDFAPGLADPVRNLVFARSEAGVPYALDTRTGETRWEYPAVGDCSTHEILAGPAGVAVSQRCPEGKERVALVNPRTGKAHWKTDIATPDLRLLAVGTNSVVVYQGGMVQEVIALGPGGRSISRTACACGDGASLEAGTVGGGVIGGGTLGPIGVGGVVVLGGPFGLVGLDADTGEVRWRRAVPGGPVHRVLTGEDEAHVIAGDGALFRVDPAGGDLAVVVPATAGPLGAGPLDAGPLDVGPLDVGPLDAGSLDPGAIVVPAAGYLAAGTAGGFTFSGPR